LSFKDLYLYNFRNFKNLKINLDFSEVYFVGSNGQGKTNILESLYYLCYGSSFKTKNDSIIVEKNSNQMSATSNFFKNDGSLNHISIQLSNGLKKIICNEKIVYDRKDIMQNMPCIIFCHGDLEFVIGTPDQKRIFFDQTISLIDNDYVSELRNYKNILKTRNKILKKEENDNLLHVYTEQLVKTGLVIQKKRDYIINKFNEILSEKFNLISDLNGELKIEYLSSWKNSSENEINIFLKSKLEYELKMKTSCFGPHRDNFKFIFNGEEFNSYASTGQLRLTSLILRATQGDFYYKKTGNKPILLLDDVLLELDNEKRDKFMKNLPCYSQAFYTFLPESSVLKNSKAKIYFVKNGEIFNEKSW